ncbi:DUF974-domain-containing protein [Artomyces pyxidatus]|uniref:DUF974-domain-containing protein n=1 Tax=Artomyces pyxidatus TaxID=48021 RepID=A0ACB8SN28_9AGAM|nr:DUF974-domain-containing protein [Artomyces pyxidatus]
MDGPGHLLSLKVMRVSRPALATAWEPFYSNSPAFSAHSTASVLSLQGSSPLPGHPKTLRDLTNASVLLTLPSSFGAIQLGETFSGALAVNNETSVAVDGVVLRVEMQTATTKVLLTELGGPTFSLAAGDTLETVVSHEIKELGQHVLACTVTYQLPPGARRPLVAAEGTDEGSTLQTFRKFYKFAVTNPLSVKTKVHTPRSPSALLSHSERSKVFLEIHIQNLTQEPMWFERMIFEPAQGWTVDDANFLSTGTSSDGSQQHVSLFSGSTAMMQPQDARQYIYILSEVESPAIPVQHPPGTVLPLGRLDISWRSSFGEPGRLLTSMLSRRIPLLPPAQPPRQQQHPASALPLHLQRSAGNPAASLPPSRSGTPPLGGPAPYRPASPFRNRPMSVPPPRPQSPVTFAAAGNAMFAPASATSPSVVFEPVGLDLVVRKIPRGAIPVDKPFGMTLTMGVSASIPEGRTRILSLVVQHVQLPRTRPTPLGLNYALLQEAIGGRTSTFGGAAISPATAQTARMSNTVLEDRPLVQSPTRQQYTAHGDDEITKRLPRPVPEPGDEDKYAKTQGVQFLGSSVLFCPAIALRSPATEPSISEDGSEESSNSAQPVKTERVEEFWDFELEYMPIRTGFLTVGGLRVILIEDRMEEEGADRDGAERRVTIPRTLKEWDVVGEIWVSS